MSTATSPFMNPSPAYQRAKNLGSRSMPLIAGEVAVLGKSRKAPPLPPHGEDQPDGEAMTEDEAKTKWCPFSRVLSHTYAQDGQGRIWEGGYAYNRQPDEDADYIPGHGVCIGSACMAWRWGLSADFTACRDFHAAGETINAIKELRRLVPSLGLVEAKLIVLSGNYPATKDGFCGLAGAPQ